MNHSFNIDIAKQYGLYEAILFENIMYWCEHNRANEKHFYDGNYWTYNSTRAFSELFPYLSSGQIERALKELKDAGLIEVGNYSANAYDRTRWFAISKRAYSIYQKQEIHSLPVTNGFTACDEPIPIINNNKYITSITLEKYVEKWNSLYPLFSKITKLTPKRQSLIKARLKDGYTQDEILDVFERASRSDFLVGKNGNGWKADFDWVLKAERFVEIVEGKWDNRTSTVTEKPMPML